MKNDCPACNVYYKYEKCHLHTNDAMKVEYMKVDALERIADSLEQINITLTHGVNNAAVEVNDE